MRSLLESLRDRTSFKLHIAIKLLAGIAVSVALILPLHGQISPGPETIRVWRVGSPHRGDVPQPTVPPDFQAIARTRGLQFDVTSFAAKDFYEAFRSARVTRDEPDLLVFDNMGLVRGIITARGTFEGIADDPNVATTLVDVKEALKSWGPKPWQYLITSSRHYQAARMLATRPIDCRWMLPDAISHATDSIDLDLRRAAEQAATDYISHGVTAASEDPVGLGDQPRRIAEERACDAWGNDRLAFVVVVTSFEGPKDVGYRSLAVAVAKVDGVAHVLSIGDFAKIVSMLQHSASRLTSGPAKTVPPPALIAPVAEASSLRMPPEKRPLLEWRSDSAPGGVYLVEWQFGDQSATVWRGSGFSIVKNNGPAAMVQAPFGVGRQPHRWRIWAIDEAGNVGLSEWRILRYVN